MLLTAPWDAGTVAPLAGFAAALFTFYSLAPVLLRRRGAAALNLSLLSSGTLLHARRVPLAVARTRAERVHTAPCLQWGGAWLGGCAQCGTQLQILHSR